MGLWLTEFVVVWEKERCFLGCVHGEGRRGWGQTIPGTADPYFFRTRTQLYGYGKITGTGENSKKDTEYGISSEVFENAMCGYGNEFF